MARRGVIGAGGVGPVRRVRLRKGDKVWMGASSSPDYVEIVELTQETIRYRPEGESVRAIQRWIGEDLIARGTSRRLRDYAKYYETRWQKEGKQLRRVLGQREPSKRRASAPEPSPGQQRAALSSAIRRDKK